MLVRRLLEATGSPLALACNKAPRLETLARRLHVRLQGAGTLDVVGPDCPASHNFADLSHACAADPAVLPIGVTYTEASGPKPTGGPVIPSARIPLTLRTGALRSGTYHLSGSGEWRLATSDTSALHLVVMTINFTVTGPY